MEQLMTAQESYVERRRLFKDIWDIAMHIDDKDDEFLNKHKVIKTLRLDEVDRCAAGKKKKQKLKNLRAVCNKILDFCDRQDADDTYYEQMATEGNIPAQHKPELKLKKLKPARIRKKANITKSLFSPGKNVTQPRTTTSDGKEEFKNNYGKKTLRNSSPMKAKRTIVLKKLEVPVNIVPKLTGLWKTSLVNSPRDMYNRRKVVKKKNIKTVKKVDIKLIHPPGI
ncbi:uncharacterized protein LOC113523480 [Galleria mellonella]|uniref:Uncharacterized protein LOC113523480 n=1 Tax=Galleria mellonella TaxID=7137 RepID=A0A6J1X6M8_GALME|nr:uncharacterized protein LOC113523480 [Galleria mellonella]